MVLNGKKMGKIMISKKQRKQEQEKAFREMLRQEAYMGTLQAHLTIHGHNIGVIDNDNKIIELAGHHDNKPLGEKKWHVEERNKALIKYGLIGIIAGLFFLELMDFNTAKMIISLFLM